MLFPATAPPTVCVCVVLCTPSLYDQALKLALKLALFLPGSNVALDSDNRLDMNKFLRWWKEFQFYRIW